jgi:hypothetical protein
MQRDPHTYAHRGAGGVHPRTEEGPNGWRATDKPPSGHTLRAPGHLHAARARWAKRVSEEEVDVISPHAGSDCVRKN